MLKPLDTPNSWLLGSRAAIQVGGQPVYLGRGALVVAGISAYCVGNLHLEGYELPWEEAAEYPANLAPPRQIQTTMVIALAIRTAH